MTTADAYMRAGRASRRWGDVIRRLDLRWIAVGGLLTLAAIAFWGTLDEFFVQDDFIFLAAAEKDMPNIEMWRGVCFFRPLSTYWLSLLNVSLWGLRPFWHHATCMVIFLATIGLLFFWLRSVAKSTAAALAGAGLYALSKTHLYTLAWIAGGIDVTAALFVVLGLWATDAYLKRSDANGGRGQWTMLLLTGAAFVCGLLCKESCAVFAPACAAWVVARMFIDRRWLTSAEKKLAIVLALIVVVYLPLWKMYPTVIDESAGRLQFNLSRGVEVLKNSVIAVVPATEQTLPRSAWWLLAAAALTGLAARSRRRNARSFGYIILGLSMWILPAALFIFTCYPWALQLYYSHFSVIGLSLLAALAVESLQAMLRGWRLRAISDSGRARAICGRAAAMAAILLLLTWLGTATATIRSGVRHRASPALFQAVLSRSAFDAIEPHLCNETYNRVVFLDMSDVMWASIYFGQMVHVFYPKIETACDGRDGFKAAEQMHSTPTTLVVRQTGFAEFTVVR